MTSIAQAAKAPPTTPARKPFFTADIIDGIGVVLDINDDLNLDTPARTLAAADHAEALAARLRELATKQHKPGTFTIRVRNTDAIHTETCPTGCTTDHQPDVETPTFLEDITHWLDEQPAMNLPVWSLDSGTVAADLLWARITVSPYADNPKFRTPHATLVLFEEDGVMEALSPDEFAEVIGKLRSHLDVLDQVHARLVQAVAEWQERQA